jgi:hypothetical protein
MLLMVLYLAVPNLQSFFAANVTEALQHYEQILAQNDQPQSVQADALHQLGDISHQTTHESEGKTGKAPEIINARSPNFSLAAV